MGRRGFTTRQVHERAPQAAATPRAVWRLADTPALTDAGLLPGEDVHKHLKGCGQAILLAVTLGPGVDAQIRRAGVGDIAAASSGTAHFCSSASVAASGSPCAPKYRAACARSTACGFSNASGRGTPIAMSRTSLLLLNKVLLSIPHLWAFINPAKREK